MLAKEAEIKERWQKYFSKVLTDEGLEDFQNRERESIERQFYSRLCESISKDEIKEALKKISNRKAEGSDQILVEVLKYLGEESIQWMAEFFNVIFRIETMPKE